MQGKFGQPGMIRKACRLWGRQWRALLSGLGLVVLLGGLSACTPAIEVSNPAEPVAPATTAVPIASPLPDGTAERLSTFLAEQTGLDPGQITRVQHEARDWSDACLEVTQAGELCAQMITPGYRVVMATPQGEYVLHCDRTAQNIRIAQAP